MSNNQQIVMNRIKVTLVEKQKTNRWLAEQMGKSENTISRWCSNKSQPSIIQLQEIANLYNPQIQISEKSQTKRIEIADSRKTKRPKIDKRTTHNKRHSNALITV